MILIRDDNLAHNYELIVTVILSMMKFTSSGRDANFFGMI